MFTHLFSIQILSCIILEHIQSWARDSFLASRQGVVQAQVTKHVKTSVSKLLAKMLYATTFLLSEHSHIVATVLPRVPGSEHTIGS